MTRIIIIAALALASFQANAATAYLVSCSMGMSVTGRTIYTGIYQYGATRFARSFETYCPYSVEVF